MKKIFLHIGAGKTGTSALQSHFVLNKEHLKKNNYYYPTVKNESKAKELKITAGNGVELAQLLMKKECNTKAIQSLASKYIQDADGKDIIISSEILMLFQPECAKVFKEAGNMSGYEIVVIYYVRAIADHLLSSYHQQLKRHVYSKKFTAFIGHKRNTFLETIFKCLDVFGRESLIVKNYDVVKGNIFLDFMKNILQIDNMENLIVKNKNINRSLTEFEVSLMRHMNMSFEHNRDSTFISDALIYGDPNVKYEMSISSKNLKIISEKYSNETEKINMYLCEEERPLRFISGLTVKEDHDIALNNFQKSVLSILAAMTKKIK